MPPVNDNFIDATDLGSAESGTVTFDITDASLEPGEIDHANGHTVWFKWTAPDSDAWVFDTAATPLPRWDSTIAIYTGGPTLADLTFIGSDDDDLLQPGSTATDGFGTSQAIPGFLVGDVVWIQINSYDYPADAGQPSAGYPRTGCVLRWYRYGGPPPPPTFPPVISGIAPQPAVATETVTLTGLHFTGATGVMIGGVTAPYTVDSDTQITASVPATAATGLPVTVTNSDGTGSSITLTVYYPGPWSQPPDQWAPWLEGPATAQIWQATWADGDPQPGYPSTSDAPNTTPPPDSLPGQIPGWRVWRTGAITGFDYDAWVIEVTEWLAGVNFDGDLPFSLPPIRPSIAEQTAPYVADFETELVDGGAERGYGSTARGVPLGDVEITIDMPQLGASETVKTATSDTPPDSSDIVAAELRGVRIEPADYEWSGAGPTGTQWVTDARFRALPAVASAPVADGPLAPVGPTPTQVWEAFHVPPPADTVLLALTLADLDPGPVVGAFAAAFAVSLFIDDTTASLPDPGSGGFRPQVGKGAGIAAATSGDAPFISGRLYYRPPRYRMLYISPLAPASPPLRQYPRDDRLGGAPRQGRVNAPTSRQASRRQGWRNTYR
jgi:hypothetical protein